LMEQMVRNDGTFSRLLWNFISHMRGCCGYFNILKGIKICLRKKKKKQ
jgi:hypothetical protein